MPIRNFFASSGGVFNPSRVNKKSWHLARYQLFIGCHLFGLTKPKLAHIALLLSTALSKVSKAVRANERTRRQAELRRIATSVQA